MKYLSYRYLWPPRPETAVPPDMLHHYEEMGWWAQAKFNGDCTVIYVPPDRKSFAKGRHGPDNDGRWQPGDKWAAFAETLPGEGWHVFVGEALHRRGVGIVDTIVLFDILVCNGDYLVGNSFEWRTQLLWGLLGFRTRNTTKGSPLSHWEARPGVWVANPMRPTEYSFRGVYDAFRPGAVEGLVLKDPAAPLALCSSATANGAWQSKCRKSTNQISF